MIQSQQPLIFEGASLSPFILTGLVLIMSSDTMQINFISEQPVCLGGYMYEFIVIGAILLSAHLFRPL